MRLAIAGLLFVFHLGSAFGGVRARDLGIPFKGTPAALNAITDVPGVEVGQTTIISGNGPLNVGVGPVRTGVTIVLPRGKNSNAPTFGAWFALNGTGEVTGTTYLEEYGLLEGPVALTNTQSVGTVRDAVAAWLTGEKKWELCCLPVVAETWDGELNDINGFHVHAEHVRAALRTASGGPVAEGNVGGGTGMVAFGFKGGTGTSSRVVSTALGKYVVGVLVQANMGKRDQLLVAGVPVGHEISMKDSDLLPPERTRDSGSIIAVIATDAPLLPHQLKRIAKRATIGLGRTGAIGGDSSGDIFIAFSTANAQIVGLQNGDVGDLRSVVMLPNDALDPLFEATIESTEEAIINALVAAGTMTGANGRTVMALPHDRLKQILANYGRANLR
jgi:L-aminopeptidase/D-esterase-like protein